jgi:hypothetical protein
MQSKTAGDLPLENYHAASLARLIGYLVIWNGFHQTPRVQDSETYLLDRSNDPVSICNVYASVSASVFSAGMSASYLGFSPTYAGSIEEAYGKMYSSIFSKSNWKTALACLTNIKASHDNKSATAPSIASNETKAVRIWLVDMIEAVGVILATSAQGHASKTAIKSETEAASAKIKANQTNSNMSEGLALINPTRERFMAEKIAAAPVPSLIKTGRNHLVGLQAKAIADTKYHYDAKDFETDLKKRAADL